MSTYRAVPLARRVQHEERLLHLLRERGALSRAEIAGELRMSRATLSEVASGLLRRGAIVVHETDAAQREGSGRPAERLVLDPASGQFLGVDMGHHRTRVAIADASHTVLAEAAVAYTPGLAVEERLTRTFALIDELTAGRALHLRALQGIAVGVPGPFSARPQQPVPNPLLNLPAAAHTLGAAHEPGDPPGLHPAQIGPDGEPLTWAVGDRIRKAFEDRYAVPVLLGNNTRFAALAEAAAVPGPSGPSGQSGQTEPAGQAGQTAEVAGGGLPDLVYVRLSEGVGGGLVIGGQLVGGWVGVAGEFGHVVVEPGGARCRCGRRGCLETVASVPAVHRRLRERGLDVEAFADIEPGDKAREQVLREAAEPLGRLLAVHAITLNPSEIVLGGELGQHPVVLAQVRQTCHDQLGVFAVSAPRIRAARLSDDDGCLGALTALYQRPPPASRLPDVAGATDVHRRRPA